MTIDIQKIGMTTASTTSSITEGVKWFGRSVSSFGQSAWKLAGQAAATIASVVSTIWTKAQPILAKVFQFVTSPMGIGLGLTGIAGALVKRANHESDNLKQAAMQASAICCALVAGLLWGKFTL
ncbi:hypothetical protein SCG7086_AL_00270 [Chlamydiales bacterium SCGC AG-110-P3]|nr:hypothetical protein SCG7086_AL_00270 [Chlamydiales bacterium SCGC AG-110-P3]